MPGEGRFRVRAGGRRVNGTGTGRLAIAALVALGLPAMAAAQQGGLRLPAGPGLNLYGAPGLIDMPGGEAAENGEMAATASYLSAGQLRVTGSFQVLPRLSGSFRYTIIDNWAGGRPTYDRSLDLRYLVRREGGGWPAITVGIQDFMGTGIFSGEYVAATRSFGPRLKVTGGIGWGRLGSQGSFANPLAALIPGFATRPTGTSGTGGLPEVGRWFRGPAALFGGIEYRATPRLTLKAELSSDAYANEVARGIYTHRIPVNLGAEWRASRSVTVGGYFLNGTTVAARASYALNLRHSPAGGLGHPAPQPVIPRPSPKVDPAAWRTGWVAQPDAEQILADNLATLLAPQGIAVKALDVTATTARLWFVNDRYDAEPEAVGRIARVLTTQLPASVETFVLIPVREGLPLASITIARSDLEANENRVGGSDAMLARSGFASGAFWDPGAARAGGAYPSFRWSITPYAAFSFFDPDNPVRADFGARLQARYEPRPGLVFSTEIRKKVVGNLDSVTRVSDSVVRHVRSDYGLYDRQGDPAIKHLTVERFFRPGENLYGRVTAGYLETMYAGVSGEVLFKPANSRLGLGLELNAVRQRAFNQLLGLQAYGVVTGHASAYWEFRRDFYAQLDAGRYLLGDWGATFSLIREFDNGWKLGGFVTLTDLPFSQFGEGSFDKGIIVEIPLSWFTGHPTLRRNASVIRPLTRDGGARLEVRNRLYGLVRDYHRPAMAREWGRFWR